MTEEEAKTKWCPMGRSLYAEYAGDAPKIVVALNTDRVAPTMCIGSACMMWQKIRIPQDSPIYKITFTGQELHSQQIDIVDYGGYCGLAGKQ